MRTMKESAPLRKRSRTSPTSRARLGAAIAIASATLALSAQDALGTHFRFGHIHWAPGANPNEINFVVQNAWRWGPSTCVDPVTGANIPCSGMNGEPLINDIVRQSPGGLPNFAFGDGSTSQLFYLVTSIDDTDNWYFGVAVDPARPLPWTLPHKTTITHAYAAPGVYEAAIQSCCRLSAQAAPNVHVNNPDGFYRIATTVSVGGGNRSPIALVPPIVLCPVPANCTFPITAVDPDGDTLQFRLSTSPEATGGLGPLFVHPGTVNAATIDANTGEYQWTTVMADLVGFDPNVWNVLYSTQVTIEDLDAAGNVKDRSVVDFFIQLVEQVGDPPDIDIVQPGIDCGSTVVVTEGDLLTFEVIAWDPDVNDLVTLNAVGLPGGAMMDPPLPLIGNPVTSEFSWIPGPADVGAHIVIFTATDQAGQGVTCPITIEVVAAPTEIEVPLDIRPTSCPNPLNVRSRGVLPVAILGTDTLDVLDINPDSILLEGVAPLRWAYEDVATPYEPFMGKTDKMDCTTDGPDGWLDLTLKFSTQAIVAALGFVNDGDVLVLQLTGELNDGTPIVGEDVVFIIKRGN